MVKAAQVGRLIFLSSFSSLVFYPPSLSTIEWGSFFSIFFILPSPLPSTSIFKGVSRM